MNTALFINAGLGNALMLLPLAKALKNRGDKLTAIVTSPWPCEELFVDTDLFDTIEVLRKNRDQLGFGMRHARKFDVALLDFFAATRKNLLLAKSIAPKVVTNHWPDRNMPAFASMGVIVRQPAPRVHEGTQNMRLVYRGFRDLSLSMEQFAYPGSAPNLAMLSGAVTGRVGTRLASPFIALQVSGGNNTTPYKNWPPKCWAQLLSYIHLEFPSVPVVLLGDANEIEIGQYVASKAPNQVIDLVGKTTIREAMAILNECALYLGVDSGLMHIAASLGKPTLTVWGASNPDLFAYWRIDPERHKVVRHKLFCQPCNAWIEPNTKRVEDPLSCPDYKCIRDITPEEVMAVFQSMCSDLKLF